MAPRNPKDSPEFRRPARIGPGPKGELPELKKWRGIVGVRKMAVGVLQQQLEYMRNRILSEDEREFVIEVVKALVIGEKVTSIVKKEASAGNLSGGTQLPALEAKT